MSLSQGHMVSIWSDTRPAGQLRGHLSCPPEGLRGQLGSRPGRELPQGVSHKCAGLLTRLQSAEHLGTGEAWEGHVSGLSP